MESVAYVTWGRRHCGHTGCPVVRTSPGDSSEEEEEDEPGEAEGDDGDAARSSCSTGVRNRCFPAFVLNIKGCVPCCCRAGRFRCCCRGSLHRGVRWHAGEEEGAAAGPATGSAQQDAGRGSGRRLRRKHRTRSAFADWQDGSAPAASRDGPLEGVILRSQLMVLLTKRVRAPLSMLWCCSGRGSTVMKGAGGSPGRGTAGLVSCCLRHQQLSWRLGRLRCWTTCTAVCAPPKEP